MNGSRYVVPPVLPLASVFPGLLQHIIANTTRTFTHSDFTKPANQGLIIQKGRRKVGSGYFMSHSNSLTCLGQSGAVQLTGK